MRRFRVWCHCAHSSGSSGRNEEIIELPDTESDKSCDAACAEAIDTIIGNVFDSGWEEITDKENHHG